MDIQFTWDPSKAKRNLRDHKISFQLAQKVFTDPHAIFVEDCQTASGEMRYHAIGYAGEQLLTVVVFVDLSQGDEERLHILSARKAEAFEKQSMQTNSPKKQRTPPGKRQGIKISERSRKLYEQRDRRLEKQPDAPVLPPDKWANALRREEFFRPVKKQTTVRIDADVLAWLKSKGQGHLSRINEILRERMRAELKS